MEAEDTELMRKVMPTKQILDFDLMSGPLSTPEGFRNEILPLCGDQSLPLVFPGIPDYFKARIQGIVTNMEARDGELTLPRALYDSDTYNDRPELRGPMEELILGYENERLKQGLPNKVVVGSEWSQTFVERLYEVQHPPLSEVELMEANGKDNDSPKPPLKGTKIA